MYIFPSTIVEQEKNDPVRSPNRKELTFESWPKNSSKNKYTVQNAQSQNPILPKMAKFFVVVQLF